MTKANSSVEFNNTACFECSKPTNGKHLVVRGGSKHLPLCSKCKANVYITFDGVEHGKLIKLGQIKSGKTIGAPTKIHKRIDKIMGMYSTGSTIREIAKATKLSIGSVHGVIKALKKPTEWWAGLNV